jgi:CheY-like chemotaxis protein
MADEQRPNTLGLREKELNSLLGELENSAPSKKAGRVFSRWRFREKSVAVRITQPGGSDTQTRMACRNLSQQGIGLLHRSYVHIGTACIVILPHPTKGDQEYQGTVVRCLHVSGMVHEIGIKFDEDIPLRDITRPDPMQEVFAIEQVDPQSLVGTILLVEDSDMDVKLVKHFLRDTQLRVKHCETIAEAEQEAKAGVGLVLCDIHLGDEYGGDLAKRLYEHGASAPPVVMISADRSDKTYKLITEPFVEGFLSKPFSQESLIRSIAEFMIDPSKVVPVADAGQVQADPQIVGALLPELTKACGKLRDAVDGEDATLAFSLVMQISGVAPVMGLNELAGIAETVGQKLASTMDLEGIKGRLEEIERLCSEAVGR